MSALAVFMSGKCRATLVLRRLDGVASISWLGFVLYLIVFTRCSLVRRRLTGCVLTPYLLGRSALVWFSPVSSGV